MGYLTIETREQRLSYAPGEIFAGTAAWKLDAPPASVELALFWYTEGKGDRDVGEAQRIPFDNPGHEDRRDFQLQIPSAGPLSFAGQLVSLQWGLELVAEPGEQTTRLLILVTTTGREIHLPRLDDPAKDAPAWAKRLATKMGKKDAGAG